MVNEGELRTFRLKDQGLEPDLRASLGVVGFNRYQGDLYVHTDGRRRIELHLRGPQSSPTVPHLIKSTGEVLWKHFSETGFGLSVRDVRPVTLEVGGLAPQNEISFEINGETQRHAASSDGRVLLELGNEAVVELSLGEEVVQ